MLRLHLQLQQLHQLVKLQLQHYNLLTTTPVAATRTTALQIQLQPRLQLQL